MRGPPVFSSPTCKESVPATILVVALNAAPRNAQVNGGTRSCVAQAPLLSCAMRRISSFLAVAFVCTPLLASSFSNRFEELKKAAAPAQLYTLLYDLPKGGDLHNHSGGSDRPEWIFDACTDTKLN